MANDDELLEDNDEELIELVDEEGNVINFRLLDVTEYKGEKYTLLLAAEPNEEIAEDEVVIFRYNEAEQTLVREYLMGLCDEPATAFLEPYLMEWDRLTDLRERFPL